MGLLVTILSALTFPKIGRGIRNFFYCQEDYFRRSPFGPIESIFDVRYIHGCKEAG